ncbi:C1 family peptidase [Leptospira sp. 96542]|nr:C1 family peptidase [Leptospira sp. 96542]
MIIKRADGTTRKVSGYRASKPKDGTKQFKGFGKPLPPKVDLRKYMTEVEDQGDLNSCTANAVAGAYEYLVKRHKEIENYDVSRLFIYYNARHADDLHEEDQGSVISSAIQSLQEYGACSEEMWPYEEKICNDEPDDDAYTEAANFIVEDFQSVPIDLNAWKSALAEGHPIIFGISLFESFDKHRKPGLVPAPTKKEASRESHGGHAMLCVGYSDFDKVFIVRNSWGNEWGDEGYCYIPYDYLMNKKYNDGDTWIIKQLSNFEIDESTWGDNTSVTGDFDTELAEMTDEEYNDMLDAMGEDYPLEFRIGLIILTAAGADGDISEEEYDELSNYMKETLDKLGVEMSAKKILKNCAKLLEAGDEDDILEESIELLGEYLSNGLLAKLLNDIREIVGVDDVSDEEEEFLGALTQAWQIDEDEDEDEDEDDDDDEDEEEDDDEDDEDDDDDEDEEEDDDDDEEEDDDDDEEEDDDEDEEDDDDDDDDDEK